jgi:hypothetical protein
MNTAKLRGFNYPLTPKGKSTLNPPPPWYYSSDFLDVEFRRNRLQWRLSCLTDWSRIPPQMVTATRSSTTGSSAVLTKNTLIRRVISIASSSYSWTHCSKVDQYRTAPTFSLIMMLRSHVAGLRVIRSVSGKCSKPGITPRQVRQVRLLRQDQSSLAA